ncbi:MAG: hypothetical protein WA706_24920 [Pseudolabrys sp.]
MRSATELTPSAGLTASTLGWVTNWVTVAMSLRGSQGNRAYNRVLMASGPPMLTPMVEPSGVAFATRSVPRLSPAPGLFSTINALAGYFCCKPSATRRATMSLGQKALRSAPCQSCATAVVVRASTARNALTACFAVRNAASTFIEG